MENLLGLYVEPENSHHIDNECTQKKFSKRNGRRGYPEREGVVCVERGNKWILAL